MKFYFAPDIPEGNAGDVILISGPASTDLRGRAYILSADDQLHSHIYEIRYGYSCSSFREAVLSGDVLAVGYEGFFYLFDVLHRRPLLQLEMDGYFGHLYLHDGHFYVASATSLHRMDMTGRVIWCNDRIGIDGVIIDEFSADRILVQGEMDPPGGWIPFTLDLATGVKF